MCCKSFAFLDTPCYNTDTGCPHIHNFMENPRCRMILAARFPEKQFRNIRCFLLVLLLTVPLFLPSKGLAEGLSLEEMRAAQEAIAGETLETSVSADPSAREAMIDGIIDLAQQLYTKAGGKPQRAHYSGDIYICKNFTVHLFRTIASDFRMAEYPETPLIIPNNQLKADCAPYVYGIEWQDISAADGNPFYVAASFRYDADLTQEENEANARAFLKQVKRGDFFQMAANYYYGVGAHSLIFIADYDPETDSVHWADSNMKGTTINGERYAYVQYDAVKEIDWFVEAFCRKKYGATLYRLREDIIYAP